MGELIDFEQHRKTGHSGSALPQPRGSAARTLGLGAEPITGLLSELAELTRMSKHVPPTTLDQARAGLEKGRRIVRPSAAAQTDLAGVPQPQLDDERIERMYRELNQNA